jgi:DNA-binding NarL/FixJ family response regulator
MPTLHLLDRFGSHPFVLEQFTVTHNHALPTKILIVDHDEASFQVQQCIAKALANLPPVELYHARDATEALSMLDRLSPDVVVMDDEEPEEKDLLIDSLVSGHPPILLQTDENLPTPQNFNLDGEITRIPKSESLEGIHQTLMLAVAIGVKFTGGKSCNTMLH